MSLAPGACSLFRDEPLPGTAAHETGWLCLEHPRGWGRDVLDGEALGELTGPLRAKAAAAGMRLLLIRRPGRYGEDVHRRRLYVARCLPGGGELRTLLLDATADVLEVDLAADLGRVENRPLFLVCAHGRRDVCCAVSGRPLAAALAEHVGDRSVWECSHTGGHRFAPTLIALPSGLTYGRLGIDDARGVVDELRCGRVDPTGLRGRSVHRPPEQVAEVTVLDALEAHGERVAPGELRARLSGGVVDGPAEVAVEHVDGRTWRVWVGATPLPPRSVSCGAEPTVARAWSGRLLD